MFFVFIFYFNLILYDTMFIYGISYLFVNCKPNKNHLIYNNIYLINNNSDKLRNILFSLFITIIILTCLIIFYIVFCLFKEYIVPFRVDESI
ncbi:hypothetical protein EHP00_1721 [Ecytonucleospora hepatopenaei]|uniref:Uncharacterized protein n=1 Tax=Ecytonucleospora hepatopenaei TaxID=646526 RepID=A0A1W0E663_9MICR|nr:hypothetical protein EHP00_1721 [Ecytonucleospora hepatopenaei]